MLPYIFYGTQRHPHHRPQQNLRVSGQVGFAAKQIVKSGRKSPFRCYQKQAKDIVAEAARSVGMPYVTERWLGGMMTNFATIRRSVKRCRTSIVC